MSASLRLPPGYRGHVDAIEPVLTGWVVDAAHPAEPVIVTLVIDHAAPIPVRADRPRADVAAAGLGGPDCGFAVELPARLLDGAEHELTLLLPGDRDLALPGLPPRVALGPLRAALISPEAAELDAVLDLLCRTEAEAGFDPQRITRETAAAFNAIRLPQQGFMFYAQTGNRLVGYGRLERGEPAGCGVIGLTVLAAYRRKRLGEALLRALLDAAANEPGLRQVWLSVHPDNHPALRLYEKLGFVRDARHPPGRWANPGEITMNWQQCR